MQDFKLPKVKAPSIKAPELPKSPQDEQEALIQNLTTQYQNLEERLTSMGAIDNRSPLEKLYNLPDEQGPLLDFFDILDQTFVRPIQGAILSTKDPEVSVLEGAYRGFRGQEVAGLQRWTGLDFAEQMGWTKPQEEMTGFGRFARNVAIDILMDPLTYIAPTKVFKFLFNKGEVARAVKMVAGSQFETIETALRAANKTWNLATTDEILDIARKADIDLRKFDDMLQEGFEKTANPRIIRKSVSEAAGAGEEALVGELMARQLDNMGEAGKDLLVVLEAAQDRTPDIMFFRRTMSGSGDEVLMKLKNLEVKKLRTKAYGPTFTLKVEDGVVDFVGKNAKALDPAQKAKLVSAINKVQDVADETNRSIADIVQELFAGGASKDKAILAARQTATKLAADQGLAGEAATKFIKQAEKKAAKEAAGVSFTFTDDFLKSRIDLDDQTYTTFKELLGELFLDNRAEWYGFVDKSGELRTVRGENLFDYIDVNGRITYNQKGRQVKKTGLKPRELRMSTELSLVEDTLDDATDEFIMEMLSEGITEEVTTEVVSKPGVVINMLTALTSDKAPALIRKPAQIVRDVAQTIERTFNAKAGLSSDFIPKLTRIQGEAGYLVQSKSKQLAQISDNILQVNAKGLNLASEIIETGAKIDPQTGEVIVQAYIEQTAKLMDNIKVHTGLGNTAILPIPGITADGSKLTAQNIQDTLNRIIYNQETIDDAFEVVEAANGAYGVVLNNIDYDTLKKINFRDLGAEDSFINFGRRQLSDEAAAFLTQPGIAADVEQLRTLRNEMSDILVKELGFDEVPDALIGTQEYVRHTLTDEAKKYLKDSRPAVRSKFIREGIDLLQARNYVGSIDDINKGLKAFYGLNFDVFDTNIQSSLDDLIRLTSTRVEQANILEEILKGGTDAGKPLIDVIDNTGLALDEIGPSYEVVSDFRESFGNIYKNLSPGSQQVLDAYIAKLGYTPGRKAIAIHKSAKNLLDNVNKAFIDLPEWLSGYDKFLNLWKSVTLVTPGFHMRNLFGNSAQAYFVGMDTAAQMRYARNAMVDFGQFKGVVDELLALGGETAENVARLNKAQRDVYRRMKDFFESGISQSHAGVRDLLGVKNLLETGRKNIPQSIVSANFNLAERMDDVQRYMLYQWSFDKNFKTLRNQFADDVARIKARNLANQTVSNALFDYKNFTSFEKDVMKRIFPFYTFMKNNLVFQMQNIFKNPGSYARLGRAYKYSAEEFAGIDVNELPDYISGNMWIPLPAVFSSNDQQAISFLKANLPIAEFFEIVEQPLKRGATSLAAPLKLPLELGAGVDFFTGQDIREFPGEAARLEEPGFLAGLRGERGEFALSSDPMLQKIANDLGLRVPKQYLGVLFDVADTMVTEQTPVQGMFDVLQSLGLTSTKPLQEINITELYQDLERLRNMRKVWEQETGQNLPTLDDLRNTGPNLIVPR